MLLSSSFWPRSEEADSFVHPWIYSRTRRVLEFCFAALALAVSLPVFLLIAIAVRCTSRGPVLFRQCRLGRNGQEFMLLKFRSMIVTQMPGALITVCGDRRITTVGGFLRRYKLDELPQFWNVLRGDMSLVGPRPKLIQHEALEVSARPGITGPATLLFRNEERLLAELPADQVEMVYETCIKPEKARLDAAYLQNANFLSDCRVLIETVAACLRPEFYARILREHLFRTSSKQAPAGNTPVVTAQRAGSTAVKETERHGSMAWQSSVLLLLLLIPSVGRVQQVFLALAIARPESRFDCDWIMRGTVETQPFLGSDQGVITTGVEISHEPRAGELTSCTACFTFESAGARP